MVSIPAVLKRFLLPVGVIFSQRRKEGLPGGNGVGSGQDIDMRGSIAEIGKASRIMRALRPTSNSKVPL